MQKSDDDNDGVLSLEEFMHFHQNLDDAKLGDGSSSRDDDNDDDDDDEVKEVVNESSGAKEDEDEDN